ncbi:MAG: signal peptidase II [Candidatus Zixiibacteriota bacterium]
MPAFVSPASRLKRRPRLAANSRTALLWPLIIILAVAALDQFSKAWAIAYLANKPSIEVLGRFLMLTLVFNEGGAMGTSFGSSAYYLVSSLLILAVVLYYIYVNRTRARIAIPLAFTAGGAIGNIIDRIRLGQVIDFIDVDFFDINLFGYHLDRWWTFNLADAAISCSIVFLILSMLFHRRRAGQEPAPVSPPDASSAPQGGCPKSVM